MAGNRRGLTRGQIRTLFDVGPVAGLTDGQLLERFATRRDEGAELAFAALVERHGPMVLHVSRGIVRDDHEAMDVFQATFLVLARKGGTLWVRDSLGPWLHRVACRAAGRARDAAARRRKLEMRGAAMADPRSNGSSDDRKELAAVIHEEVNRLPERYRTPVVLCDLEGCTCEEAARHLGCPVGTVASRLARARERLRDRLRRRGLEPNAGLLAAAMRWQGPGASISAELVGSTARAAVQFVSIGAAAHGAAASLAQGVLNSMSMTHWWKVASLLVVMSASASGVVAFAGKAAPVAEPRADDPPEAGTVRAGAADGFEVKPGRLRASVEDRGTLEASRTSVSYSMVEGSTTIRSIVDEGTRVKKGQLVCELDSAALKDQLTNQSIATAGAEAAYQNAKLTRELAEIALQEYETGIYPREMQAAQGEAALARSAIAMADARLKRTQIARDRLEALLEGRGESKSSADILALLEVDNRLHDAEQSLVRERHSLENAQLKRDVLEKITKDKTVKTLRIDVNNARFGESAKANTWELEKKKQANLERQIKSCSLLAPNDGVVVYANYSSRFGGSQPQIEEGATVRERQKIFSLPDVDGSFRVNTKVREAVVDQLSPGLPVTIEVDAFPGQTFTGVVEDVAPRPDPNSALNPDIKVYTTHVSITKGIRGLRPGMTAKVDITVADLENVLSVPFPAVVEYDGIYHVAVKTAEGGIDWRIVILGRADDQRVEVMEGLKSGETIVPDPGPLLSEEPKDEGPPAPHKPAARPKSQPKRLRIPHALRAKLLALSDRDRQKLREAKPLDRESVLKEIGFTDDEVRLLTPPHPPANAPR